MRDLAACIAWAVTGIYLWHRQVFEGKTVPVGLWIIYGLTYFVLVVALVWWNWDEVDDEG